MPRFESLRMFIVYAQKCGSKQIHNLVPFSTSLPTWAEECQKIKISPPHFEIENVMQNKQKYIEDLILKLEMPWQKFLNM